MAVPTNHPMISFPEQQASPPQLTGEVPLPNSKLVNLRLSQLRDLARAFDLKIDLDAPKPDILPALMAAERSGVFRTRPKRPYYLYRAHWTSDQKSPLDHPYFDNPDAIEGQPIPQSPKVEEPEPVKPVKRTYKVPEGQLTRPQLVAMAKERGAKLGFGMTREQLEIAAGVKEKSNADPG